MGKRRRSGSAGWPEGHHDAVDSEVNNHCCSGDYTGTSSAPSNAAPPGINEWLFCTTLVSSSSPSRTSSRRTPGRCTATSASSIPQQQPSQPLLVRLRRFLQQNSATLRDVDFPAPHTPLDVRRKFLQPFPKRVPFLPIRNVPSALSCRACGRAFFLTGNSDDDVSTLTDHLRRSHSVLGDLATPVGPSPSHRSGPAPSAGVSAAAAAIGTVDELSGLFSLHWATHTAIRRLDAATPTTGAETRITDHANGPLLCAALQQRGHHELSSIARAKECFRHALLLPAASSAWLRDSFRASEQ